MSTAVIISGQMRTFARCYPTQRWQVYRHYEPDIHFFVSCVDDENAESAELLRKHYANVHIEKFTDPTDLPEIPIEYGDHAPYANAASHRQLMLQHWSNKRAWEFFDSKQEQKFDTIIRVRPDSFFHRFTPLNLWTRIDRTDGIIAKVSRLIEYECFTPWWGKFGGINDRFAIMGAMAGYWYFGVYDWINELLKEGCPFHPESLVAAALKMGKIESNTSLHAHFSTLRSNGDQRWPEVTSEDLAELIANR